MGEEKHLNLFQDSFPSIIREYEMYLGLNPTGMNNNEYIMLEENELPIDRVKLGEKHLSELFKNDNLTYDDISQIQQALAYLSLRTSYTLLYSRSTVTPILLPSKDNYYGLGRAKFREVFGAMVSLNNLKNKVQQNSFIKFLEGITESYFYEGKPLSIEIRIINIMIMLLKVVNNTVSVSFLAQLLLQQDDLTERLR